MPHPPLRHHQAERPGKGDSQTRQHTPRFNNKHHSSSPKQPLVRLNPDSPVDPVGDQSIELRGHDLCLFVDQRKSRKSLFAKEHGLGFLASKYKPPGIMRYRAQKRCARSLSRARSQANGEVVISTSLSGYLMNRTPQVFRQPDIPKPRTGRTHQAQNECGNQIPAHLPGRSESPVRRRPPHERLMTFALLLITTLTHQ